MVRLRIREVAQAQGFSMGKLSRASDVSFTTIKRLWQNPQADVTLSTLQKIAEALKVPVSELTEQVDEGG